MAQQSSRFLDAGSLGLRSPVRSNSAVLVRSLHVSLSCQRAFRLLERRPLSAQLSSRPGLGLALATVRFAALATSRGSFDAGRKSGRRGNNAERKKWKFHPLPHIPCWITNAGVAQLPLRGV